MGRGYTWGSPWLFLALCSGCWQCSRNICHDTHLNPCTISLASEGDSFHRMYCQFFPCQFHTQHTIFMTSLSIFSKHVKKYNIYGLELFKASFQDHFASSESITMECFLQNQIWGRSDSPPRSSEQHPSDTSTTPQGVEVCQELSRRQLGPGFTIPCKFHTEHTLVIA